MRRSLFFALLVVLLLAPAAGAQTTGTITGQVMDASGGAVPGVLVVAAGPGGRKQAFTNAAGTFRFTGLAAGTYEVSASLEGFAPETKSADVSAGAEATVEFSLTLAEAESITVTGSFIPSQEIEEGAAPIDVIGRLEFEKIGSPDFEELVRNIPQMYGHANQSNQFTFNSVHQGQKAINLRGFGSQRNLVLLNNRRAMSGGYAGPQGPITDVGAFPKIALKRIDILKEATPVYGSDAITGVFNYITDSEFEGLKVDAWHGEIDGMTGGGDNYFGVMRGFHLGPLHMVSSLDFTDRGELRQVNSDWFRKRTGGLKDGSWPQGFSSIGNPGGFLGLGPTGAVANAKLDPDCGITDSLTGADSFPLSAFQCGWYYTQFDNMIDAEQRLNVFNEFTLDLDKSQLYGHLLFSRMNYDFKTSPSYPPTAVPGLVMYVPPYNPGLAKFVGGLPAAERSTFAAGALYFGRPRAIAGFARDGGYANTGIREQEMWQLKAGDRGTWGVENPVRYDIVLSYGTTRGRASGQDVLTSRWAAALAGLGGPDCNPKTAVRGQGGCYYWNPFYEGYTTSDPALKNRADVWDWMEGVSSSTIETSQLRFNADFSGSLGLNLGGGPIGWAAGLEYDGSSNYLAVTGDQRETSEFQTTPFIFLPLTQPFGDPSPVDVYSQSAFAEFLLPFTDKFEVTLAGRYTDVPWLNDSFTKGKVSFRYRPVDPFVLRGSVSQGILVPDPYTVGFTARELQNVPFYGEFIIVETPAASESGGIGPEQADTWNLGFVWHPARNWTLSVDRWDIAFTGPILAESVNFVIANRPEQILFGPDGKIPLKITTFQYNGPDLHTSGWDFSAGADFYTRAMGSFSVGLDGSLLDEFFFDASEKTLAYDALGKANTRNPFSPFELYAMPELKYNLRFEWQKGRSALTLIHHFTDSYTTHYAAPFDKVDSFETQDLFFSYRLPGDQIILKLTGLNLTDEAPPAFFHELAYDVTAHNPIGRVVKLGISFTR